MSVFDLTNEQVGKLVEMLTAAGFSLDEIAAKMDKLPAKSKSIMDIEEKRNQNLQTTIDLLQSQSGELQAQGEWAESINQINKARHQQELNSLKSQRDLGLISKEQYETALLDLEARKEIEQVAHSTSQQALKMAQTLTGVSGAWKGTLIGSFFQGDFNANIERTALALKENFSAANMLGSALMKVQESTLMMVVSADQQFANVNKLTGTTGEYNDMIMDTMSSNSQFNVSVEDAAESVGALYEGMSNFSNMSKEAQASAVETTAQLKALGIDAQTSAANFEILNGALGMSAEQAGEVQKDFAAMAADLGVSAGKIAKDFERNSDVFTAYGDEAVRVFKETAAAAKATGIEMDALLGITTKMDTFEGAAKSAGQLNAVLGGGLLNSMDLLNASEAERTRMLIGSIEASGKSWQTMGKFEKQAIMSAAGVNDMTTANKLFGQSLSEFDEAAAKVENNAEAQAKLEERAAAAANMQDKLKRIMEQFAVAVQPIINTVHFLLDGLLSLNDMTGGMLIPTLIGLAAAMMAIVHAAKLKAMWSSIMTLKSIGQAAAESGLAGAKAALTTATTAQTAVAPASAKGSFMMARGMSALGKAAAVAGPKIAAALGPIAGIGLAVAAPILLLAVIIWSLKELVLAFMEMPGAIAPALLGLAAFIGIAVIGLPLLGAAFAGFFNALLVAEPAMVALAPVLPTMVASFAGLAVALWILGKAIQQFVGKGMPQAMVLTLASLFAFGIGLKILGPMMKKSFYKVGVNVGILAIALLLLGKALQEWNNVGAGEAVAAYISLWAFALALKPLAKVLKKGAYKVGIAVGILGLGLILLGTGLKMFNDVGPGAMIKASIALIIFGLALEFIVAPTLTKGALMVGGAAILLGIGLMLLAKGIKEFTDVGFGMMVGLAVALAIFGLALIPAGIGLAIGGSFLLYGSLVVTPALFLLAWALKPWMEMDLDKIREIGSALNDMTKGMFWAGIKMAIAGPLILWGGTTLGLGLRLLAYGLTPWMDGTIDYKLLPMIGWHLAEFAAGMIIAGLAMMYAAIPFFFGAVLLSVGMLLINKPLAEFAETLAVLAPIAPQMAGIAAGLVTIGNALPSFAWGILKLGFAASMPFFSTGMGTLNKGLRKFAGAMAGIPVEKAKAIGQLFEGLVLFTELSGLGRILMELGWGLSWIGWGMDQMPEGEKQVSFAASAESLAMLAEASVDLTPESVTNVQDLADAAFDYALASRLMRSADTDPLVNALKELAGLAKSGGSGGKTGQDVVLEIDGKEFARAVSAAIDSKHNMPF